MLAKLALEPFANRAYVNLRTDRYAERSCPLMPITPMLKTRRISAADLGQGGPA